MTALTLGLLRFLSNVPEASKPETGWTLVKPPAESYSQTWEAMEMALRAAGKPA